MRSYSAWVPMSFTNAIFEQGHWRWRASRYRKDSRFRRSERASRKTTRFDAADYLDTEERQVAYITAALETGDADFVRDALGLVARARGMGEIAKNAGLNRERLHGALGETGNPEFGTVMRIVRALGLTLSARPAATGRTSKRRRVD
jgi:probable addiction module antidote protein